MQNSVNLFLGAIFAASGIYSILYPEKARQWLIKIQLFGWTKKSVSELLDSLSMRIYGVLMSAIGAFMVYRALV
jgi:uncharacterized protein YjeT (DUF2065 family)